MHGDGGNLIGRRQNRPASTLLARAKDVNGTVQPDEHDWNYGSYVISHLLPIEVMVEDRIPLNDEALWEPI
jgi:hypothetical protein